MTVRWAARVLGALGALALLYLSPQVVLAHQLNERYEAPLPLIAYVAGAAIAVAMSFLFVIVRKSPPTTSTVVVEPQRPPVRVPAWLRYGLQALGLVAWLWIVIQSLFGGNGDGDVGTLFLWIYGWVGLALISALLGPVWAWLSPFATIHQLLGAVGRHLGFSMGEPTPFPERLGRWPAVIGFVAVVWLELVFRVDGGQPLGLFLIAYTLISVAGMAFYGRAAWLANGETFSVWFGLLGRLAPYTVVGEPEVGNVARRPFASGLLSARWTVDELVLISLGTGAIIFDGLTQTQQYFDLFVAQTPLGTDSVVRESITCFLFLGLIVLAVLGTARLLSVRAVSAGLLPVAVGYLVAHYLTYLLIDGQRIVLALNDPLLHGDNLLPGNLGFWEPSSFIPTSIVWTIQLAAVVGGHIVGAWAGHSVLAQDEDKRTSHPSLLRQLPLVVLMVTLTSLTLWSLGQAVIVTAPG